MLKYEKSYVLEQMFAPLSDKHLTNQVYCWTIFKKAKLKACEGQGVKLEIKVWDVAPFFPLV